MGGRQLRASQQPSIPSDMSPKTRAIVNYLERIGSSTRQIKNFAEPPYIVKGEDYPEVRNWLTACEDYFVRNPTQWVDHANRIVFTLRRTGSFKVQPFTEKYPKVMGGICGYTRDPDYSTWKRFRQEIISRYVGIEEEQRALEEIDKIG